MTLEWQPAPVNVLIRNLEGGSSWIETDGLVAGIWGVHPSVEWDGDGRVVTSGKGFRITHLPTGYMVGGYLPSCELAQRLVEALLPLYDWDSITPEKADLGWTPPAKLLRQVQKLAVEFGLG